MTKVTDLYFSGLKCWASQLLMSVITLEKANRLYLRPQQLYTEAATKLAVWDVAGSVTRLDLDFLYLNDLLTSKTGAYRRVVPFTPTNALDLAISRDATVKFTGFLIPDDLMTTQGLVSLEERTAYLLQAKQVRDFLIYEWNLFADIQQSLWLTILATETEGGILSSISEDPTVANIPLGDFFTPGSSYKPALTVNYIPPAYIRGVDRANYEEKITLWLLNAGTTARSGGAATSNDTYIQWLEDQLTGCPADMSLISRRSIDPREIYKFTPYRPAGGGGDGSEGISGVSDGGNPDPANQERSKALDLLEELNGRGDSLTAVLGTTTTKNIDTLPEC
jgi:hypothetical protein